MMNRKQLLRRLQVLDFAIQETALFLNSHPDDQQAMQYYQTALKEREMVAKEYEQLCGPLTNRQNLSDSWEYSKGPWPWEMED